MKTHENILVLKVRMKPVLSFVKYWAAKGEQGKQGVVHCCVEHFQGWMEYVGSVTIHEDMMCKHQSSP